MANRQGAGKVSSKQINALIFVSLLSPIIRLFPKSAVTIGGKAAWISPIVAMPLLLLLSVMIKRFMKNSAPGEGLSDMIIKAAGKVFGKILLALIAVWLIFYTGFIVKSSAERLLSSIYPNGQPGLFMGTLIAVAAWMAVGRLRSLGRLSEICAAIIGIVLLLNVVIAAFKIDIKNLLPVTFYDIDNVALSSIPVINVIGISTYLAFLYGDVEKQNKSNINVLLLLAISVVAILITTIGTLGVAIIDSLQHSFFVMIRDIELIGVVERIEAAVIVTWVITDLVYVTVLLKICGEILGAIFKKEKRKKYIIFSAVISQIPAFFVMKDAFVLHFISGIAIPIINILVVFVMLPLLFVVGIIRQKI